MQNGRGLMRLMGVVCRLFLPCALQQMRAWYLGLPATQFSPSLGQPMHPHLFFMVCVCVLHR
jgi:hypothetical protein